MSAFEANARDCNQHGFCSSADTLLSLFRKKLAADLQVCRSNVIGKGFLSPPQWLRVDPPALKAGGSTFAPILPGGVSNQSWFYGEQALGRSR
ncbi:MAG: hypothetical protein LBU11_09435 [Zoogloeaceae bacterium]|jgi:hypothetical protein|nr:hypothetical protein [Zoogloeaceae bacterium]